MEAHNWLELVAGFRRRWYRIIGTVRYSGSMEEKLVDQVFDYFVLKENVSPLDGEKYIRLVYEAVKWHSISRTPSDDSFPAEYERLLDVYENEAKPLLNKAQQHKPYRLGRHGKGSAFSSPGPSLVRF